MHLPRILTQQPRASWWAVAVILLPWFMYSLHTEISRAAITFSLRKYTDDPRIIGFVGSLNYGCGLMIGSFVSLMSDRIWTRWGRRRPFMIIGCLGAGLMALSIPHAGTFWILAGLILAYQTLYDFNTTLEPLTMEVIPDPQRGRAGAIRQWLIAGASVSFLYLLIGRFDERYELPGGLVLTGETVIYTVHAGVIFGVALLIWLGVEEVRPPGAEVFRIRDLPVWQVLKGLFTRDLLPLFGLAFVMVNVWIGLEQFEALLITEQWGFSKSDYGRALSYGVLVTVAVVPFAGLISDRMDRLVALKAGLVMVLGLKGLFYVYAEYVAPGGVPPFVAVVGMGLIRGAVASFVAVAAVPLIFEYVETNRLGALSCGMGMVFGLSNFIQTNTMGVWISFSSRWLYGLPEGQYNYMAAYHYLFVMGIAGFAYLALFSHWDRTGRVLRVARARAGCAAVNTRTSRSSG